MNGIILFMRFIHFLLPSAIVLSSKYQEVCQKRFKSTSTVVNIILLYEDSINHLKLKKQLPVIGLGYYT